MLIAESVQSYVALRIFACVFFVKVNSDIIYKRREGGHDKVFRVDTSYVGQMICTKAVGSNYLMDLTHEYKFPEGNRKEKFPSQTRQ